MLPGLRIHRETVEYHLYEAYKRQLNGTRNETTLQCKGSSRTQMSLSTVIRTHPILTMICSSPFHLVAGSGPSKLGPADKLEEVEQCAKASKKAKAMLGMINRAIKYKTKEVVLQLYKSLVRPYLDYCIQAWRPFKQKDKLIRECTTKSNQDDAGIEAYGLL
ncbi:hypothetical protein LSAT2_030337 [Lamellibrachia satsuma]|nr:hypothetical protein LSAT2_030337 [Lamellibrachia satsuma]